MQSKQYAFFRSGQTRNLHENLLMGSFSLIFRHPSQQFFVRKWPRHTAQFMPQGAINSFVMGRAIVADKIKLSSFYKTK